MILVDNLAVIAWDVLTSAAVSFAKVISPTWGEALESALNAGGEAVKRQLQGMFSGVIVDYAQKHWGVVLDPSDPFTRQSVSSGIGGKIGIPLRDVFDKDALLADVGAGLAGIVNARYGTTFSTFFPVDILQSEVETQVLNLLLESVDELHAETRAGLESRANAE